MRVLVTVACNNYCALAATMLQSARDNLAYDFAIVCMLEEQIDEIAVNAIGSDVFIVTAHEIYGSEQFRPVIFNYNITEACTFIKPFLFQWILDHFNEASKILYLDPDMYIFDDLGSIWGELRTKNIILTPHLLDDEPSYHGTKYNILRVLRHGVFNLGFFAYSRSDNARDVLTWWQSKLKFFCFDEASLGIYVDQRWADLMPTLFDVSILKLRGVNVADWNIGQRDIVINPGGHFSLRNEPLSIFHFSGITDGRDKANMEAYGIEPSNPVFQLREMYLRKILEAGHFETYKLPWTYENFDSGEKILYKSRVCYRRAPYAYRETVEDPFRLSNYEFEPFP